MTVLQKMTYVTEVVNLKIVILKNADQYIVRLLIYVTFLITFNRSLRYFFFLDFKIYEKEERKTLI